MLAPTKKTISCIAYILKIDLHGGFLLFLFTVHNLRRILSVTFFEHNFSDFLF